MPNNYITTNGGILVPDTPADPFFLQTKMLFRADKGLIDLKGSGPFDTTTAPLTTNFQKFGTTSLEFDGTTAKQMASSTSTGGQVTDTGWTMDAWIFLSSATGDRAICANQAGANANAFLFYVTSANKLAFFNNIARATSSAVVPQNQWVHVAITKDGVNNCILWINGAGEVLSGNFIGNYSAAVGLQIGARLGGTVLFKGAIDSVRITQALRWSANFTPTQFYDH